MVSRINQDFASIEYNRCLMFIRFSLFAFILSIFFFFTFSVHAQKPATNAAPVPNVTYEKAVIQTITTKSTGLQVMHVQIVDGPDKGKTITTTYDPQHIDDLKMYVKDTIILNKESDSNGKIQYYVNDKYRLPQILMVVVGFFVLILLIAGWKGIGSILGLVISLAIIFLYIIPQIIAGHDALTIAMIGSVIILLLTTYIAHGFSRQTTIALFATLIALLLTYIIANLIVGFTMLNGYGSSDATDLHFGTTSIINLKGILLAGIIISTLGALNDVTVTQAATIMELAKQNPNLSFRQLFIRGFLIGREHAISIINTLVLAFAGSSLAILIFFLFNPQQWPYWIIINSESVSEEVIKTIGGTVGLLLAVPLVTLFAAAICDKEVKRIFKELLS